MIASKPYVMLGNTINKTLSTYHLIFAPNYACNLRCKHCYLPHHSNKGINKQSALNLVNQWNEIVLEEKGRFGGIFHLKGGEPMFVSYYNDIIEKLIDMKSLQFMMTTNGTLHSEFHFNQLNRLNIATQNNVMIIVSLDGSTEEINSILRDKGSFDKTLSFAKKIVDMGITLYFNYVVHKKNLKDIPNFVNLAQKIGATQINFLNFVPKGYGEEIDNLRPDPLDVFHKIHSIWESSNEKTKQMLAGSLSDILKKAFGGGCTAVECVGGYKGLFYIEPSGDVYSCPNLNYKKLKVGNLATSSLSEMHNDLIGKVYKEIKTDEGVFSDQFLCKGEKYLPQSLPFIKHDFTRLQEKIGIKKNVHGNTYCFSRNF